MLDQANEIAQTNIDIVEIVKKLKEIDKLKSLLLTKEQIALFEYLPKKIIDDPKKEQERKNFKKRKTTMLDGDDQSSVKAFKSSSTYDSLDKYSRLYKMYVFI